MLEKLPDGSYTIPEGEQAPLPTKEWTHILNVTPMDSGEEVKTFMIDNPVSNHPRYEMCGLRKSFYYLPNELYLKAGKCQELLYWDQNTKFCGVCGAPMKMYTDISKRCINCGKEVHARNFKGDFYGLVAGFVETGETLEEAVHREVLEETGITIENLHYFGSQPWPSPSGLMIGFTADYVSGNIHLQKEELSKGAWFTKDNLPNIPEKLSIARRMLDDWIIK